MLAPPATMSFLFGSATVVAPRMVISGEENRNARHGDIAAHGFGRRGLDTCLLCHATPGAEDGSDYTLPAWYRGASPGVTMDFRTVLQKVQVTDFMASESIAPRGRVPFVCDRSGFVAT